MATFTQGFEPSTSTDGADLIITDTSVYNSTLSKADFTSRTVLITMSDGTTQEEDFPYIDLDNDVEDVLTISNFYDQDYVITIKVTWEYDNEGTPDSSDLTLDYLSNYNSLICFVSLADESECSCESTATDVLTKLNNYIENAILWAKYGNLQKSQKFLDNCKSICDSIDDCDCNN